MAAEKGKGSSYRKVMVDPAQFPSRSFATATRVVTVPIPETVGRGEALVRVTAAGVQASDIIQMAGGYGVLSEEKPACDPTGLVQAGDLGCEGVGVILQVGEGVDCNAWAVGQPVAFFGYGVAFREVTLLPVEKLFKVPAPAPEWTALPVSAMTAAGGLEVVGKIQRFAAEKRAPAVLVTGAAGGTGHIAVQWAKEMYGAKVAGTCGSEAKEKMLKGLGTDVVVNYRRSEDVEAELHAAFPGGFDIVYDAVGGRIGDIGRRLLAPQGVFVGIGSVSQDYSGKDGPDAHNKPEGSGGKSTLKEGQSEAFFFMPAGPKMIGQVAWDELIGRVTDAMATGKVKAVLDTGCSSFSGIEGVYKAQERMREGVNVGKIYSVFPEAGRG